MKKRVYAQYKIEYQGLSTNPRTDAHHWFVIRDAVAHTVISNTLHALTAREEHVMVSLAAVLRVNCDRPPVLAEEWERLVNKAS